LRIAESPLSTAQVPVIVDDQLLEQRAKELIDKGLSPWETTSIKIYVPSTLRDYLQCFKDAADFWQSYSIFKLEVIVGEPGEQEEGYIRIYDHTQDSFWAAALSNMTYGYGTVVLAHIDLYQGWIQSGDLRARIFAHELTHCLLGAYKEGEDYLPIQRYVGCRSYYTLEETVVPPVIQQVLKMLNQRNTRRR